MFYSLNSYDSQKHFVCSNVHEGKTRTFLDENEEPCDKRRKVCREFSFTIDGKKERVCKNVFLSTLAIGRSYLGYALKNSKHGVYVGQDSRGKHRPHNKTSNVLVENVKDHIHSFPVVESHYTRRDTQRKYLPSNLNIKKMYELYKEQCAQKRTEAVSSKQYKNIFNQGFNLSFHVPKKDQCTTCTAHAVKTQQGTLSEAEEASFQEHLTRRETARKEKEVDKETAKKDPTKHVVTVDMQAVFAGSLWACQPNVLQEKVVCLQRYCLFLVGWQRDMLYVG